MTLWTEAEPCAHGRLPAERCPTCELAPFQGHSITSLEAAHAMKDLAPTMREKVFKVIEMHQPINDEGICWALGMNPSTERPRRVELVKAGRIKAQGTMPTSTGRSSRCWVVVSTP